MTFVSAAHDMFANVVSTFVSIYYTVFDLSGDYSDVIKCYLYGPSICHIFIIFVVRRSAEIPTRFQISICKYKQTIQCLSVSTCQHSIPTIWTVESLKIHSSKFLGFDLLTTSCGLFMGFAEMD